MHSAILLTFIKQPFVIKIFVLSIFVWPFYTGFTVQCRYNMCSVCLKMSMSLDIVYTTQTLISINIKISIGHTHWHLISMGLSSE